MILVQSPWDVTAFHHTSPVEVSGTLAVVEASLSPTASKKWPDWCPHSSSFLDPDSFERSFYALMSRWLSCSRSKVKRTKMICDRGHQKALQIVTQRRALNALCCTGVFPFLSNSLSGLLESSTCTGQRSDVNHIRCVCAHTRLKHSNICLVRKSAASSESKHATEVEERRCCRAN